MGSEFKYFSQNGQDQYIDQEVLKCKSDGCFLDIGAHDGISFSNTYFFEKYRNWKGVCVEANSLTFSLLKTNRSSENFNCVITDSRKEHSFIAVDPPLEMLSGLKEVMSKAQMARINKECSTLSKGFNEISVPGMTFEDIKSSGPLAKIDYCSIDIEGGELELLQLIGIENIDATIFSVENALQNGYFNQLKLRKLFRDAGYTLINRLGSDDIFQKQGQRPWYKTYLDWRP